MLISKMLETTASLIGEASMARRKSLTLGVDSPDKAEKYEELELLLKKIEKASGKPVEYDTMGSYAYETPPMLKMHIPSVDAEGLTPEEATELYLAKATPIVIEALSVFKGKIQAFRAGVAKDNWKMVDGNSNQSFFMSPVEKGLFNKAIQATESLIALY